MLTLLEALSLSAARGTPRSSLARCMADSLASSPGSRSPGEPPNVVLSVDSASDGLTLLVADSLIADGGRGLYARLRDGVEELEIPSGTHICGYCFGRWTDSATGDKAVPFAFTDAQRLVMWGGELRPLQAAVAESGATGLFGHKVLRYGPNGIGVMVSIDEGTTERILVPDDANLADTTRLSLSTIGQFVNDLAFDGVAALEAQDAMWEYEKRSEKANVLTLAWDLELDGETLVPRELQLVTARDLRFAEPGACIELGLHYGVEYWRELVARGFCT